MALLIIFGILVVGVLMYALVSAAAPRTPEERKRDDEAQAKYIKDYREEYSKENWDI